ncbi:hypothetical protein F2P81_014168 [Scophthalmus maximus]|uniref:Uncharacterized protein n=1 Tax=Scophthalmus maximus TaxID=52904 RepID=A0A6A4SVJ4_SCOMX|nr:hypothetical protein F2P81_014168 [Scophthalmus maximus]
MGRLPLSDALLRTRVIRWRVRTLRRISVLTVGGLAVKPSRKLGSFYIYYPVAAICNYGNAVARQLVRKEREKRTRK